MDVEIIEDEAQDALQIADETPVLVDEDKNDSADVVMVDDPGLKIVLPEKQAENNSVEWLEDSEDSWTENESWSSAEPDEEVEPPASTTVIKNIIQPPTKPLEKKTEKSDKKGDKVDSDQDGTEKTDEATTSAAPEDKGLKSKLAGSKQSLATALLKAAKKRAADRHIIEMMKQGRKAEILSQFTGPPKKSITVVTARGRPLAITPQKLNFIRPTPIDGCPAGEPSTSKDTATSSKTKQEETLAKLQNFTKHSSELTVRKIGASNTTEITKVPMPNQVIRIQPPLVYAVTDPKKPGPSTSANSSNLTPQEGKQLCAIPARKTAPRIKKRTFRDPITEMLEKPESFLESYLRSDEIQGIQQPPPSKLHPSSMSDICLIILLPGPPRKVRHLEKINRPTDDPAPCRIRVKSNTELFSKPVKHSEEVYTALIRPASPLDPNIETISKSYQDEGIELRTIREESPLPEKYVIPQDMLMSATERVQVIEQRPEEKVNVATDYNFADMFVMDLEEDKKAPPTSTDARHKRKSSIVPKNDDDMKFNGKPALMTPRPQENIDLLDNLASYRALVGALLKKLGMPKIDFNEDSSDYINIYKIYRN